jgi:hypothetical protein
MQHLCCPVSLVTNLVVFQNGTPPSAQEIPMAANTQTATPMPTEKYPEHVKSTTTTTAAASAHRSQSNAALEVRVLSTGGSRRAATTVRNDFGADRTACDAARGMSIRFRSPVGQKYEAVFGESDGECMACWQKITPKLTLRRDRRASGRPVKTDPRRKN